MKRITSINAVRLASGLQQILLDMMRKGEDPKLPCEWLEQMVMNQKGVSRKDAETVTERVIGTGIVRWEIGSNSIVL